MTTLLKLKQSQFLIRGTTRPEYAGTIMNIQIVLNAQKTTYLNQGTQKNTCQNFPNQITLRSSLPLEIWSTPPPPPPLGFWADNNSY